MDSTKMESIYAKLAPSQIPWNIQDPPEQLVELVQNRTIEPCTVLDLGCGTGNYAIYLAKLGFRVTGIDISQTAIQLAKDNAQKANVTCEFLVGNVIEEHVFMEKRYEFIYDWEMLHHIYPEDRPKYIRNVHDHLSDEGLYLSVCFNMDDPNFGGKGKYRKTPLGTKLYFSTSNELRELYEPWFNIQVLKTIEVPGKHVPHIANYALLKRK